jgi:hypothetical protein
MDRDFAVDQHHGPNTNLANTNCQVISSISIFVPRRQTIKVLLGSGS